MALSPRGQLVEGLGTLQVDIGKDDHAKSDQDRTAHRVGPDLTAGPSAHSTQDVSG